MKKQLWKQSCTVPSTNWTGHHPFKVKMLGSNPAGITIFRIGVKAARLTLTQAVVVQIHDPEPYMGLIQRQYVGLQNRSLWFESTGPCQYSPVVQMANAPDCLSGDRGFESRRGCHTAPSSNRRGRQPLKLVMLSSSLTGVTMDHRRCAAGHCFPEPAARGQKAFQSPQLPVTCLTMPAGAGTGPENRGWPLGHGDRHLRQAPYLE